MKKSLNLVLLLFISFFISCNESDDSRISYPSSKEEWSKTLLGNGKELGAYPDFYVNYWEFTYSMKKNSNIALCLKGEFPHSRYFSISLYDDVTGSAVGSVEDSKIVPDNGSVNPFSVSSSKKNYFTIYIVPATMAQKNIDNLPSKNICIVKEGIDKLAICERQYLGMTSDGSSYDEYGGVELPHITAIDINTLKEVELPEHIECEVWNSSKKSFQLKSDSTREVPMFLASQNGYYPNYETNYLYGRTNLEQDSVLVFSFIPVDAPTKVEDYATANARYWSICFGSAVDTRSYYSRCDKDAIYRKGEKCTFVVCNKNNPKYPEISEKIAAINTKGGLYNLCPWDSEELNFDGKRVGNTLVIMYRQILPNKNWEHSISHMTPTPYFDGVTEPIENALNNKPDEQIADRALGAYGFKGVKYSSDDFLNDLYLNN